MDIDKYVNRLYQEWKTHEKIIISVDYDDTLYPFKLDNTEDVVRTVKLVKQAQEIGAYIVIFTASTSDRYKEIKSYCNDLGINVDSINTNPIKLPYGNNGKIYYNINICDRSGLNQALDILEETMKKMNNENT